MNIHLPQYLVDDLFHQHEDERDRMRAGIPSSILPAQVSGMNKTEFKYTSMNKRQYGKKFKLLKF